MNLLNDQKSTNGLAKHLISLERNKHIERRFYFLRKQVNNKRLKLKYCQTEMQLADKTIENNKID